MPRNLRVSYHIISRCWHELRMAVRERFSFISDAELDELVSEFLRTTPDAGDARIIVSGGSCKRVGSSESQFSE